MAGAGAGRKSKVRWLLGYRRAPSLLEKRAIHQAVHIPAGRLTGDDCLTTYVPTLQQTTLRQMNNFDTHLILPTEELEPLREAIDYINRRFATDYKISGRTIKGTVEVSVSTLKFKPEQLFELGVCYGMMRQVSL